MTENKAPLFRYSITISFLQSWVFGDVKQNNEKEEEKKKKAASSRRGSPGKKSSHVCIMYACSGGGGSWYNVMMLIHHTTHTNILTTAMMTLPWIHQTEGVTNLLERKLTTFKFNLGISAHYRLFTYCHFEVVKREDDTWQEARKGKKETRKVRNRIDLSPILTNEHRKKTRLAQSSLCAS